MCSKVVLRRSELPNGWSGRRQTVALGGLSLRKRQCPVQSKRKEMAEFQCLALFRCFSEEIVAVADGVFTVSSSEQLALMLSGTWNAVLPCNVKSRSFINNILMSNSAILYAKTLWPVKSSPAMKVQADR